VLRVKYASHRVTQELGSQPPGLSRLPPSHATIPLPPSIPPHVDQSPSSFPNALHRPLGLDQGSCRTRDAEESLVPNCAGDDCAPVGVLLALAPAICSMISPLCLSSRFHSCPLPSDHAQRPQAVSTGQVLSTVTTAKAYTI